MSKLKIDGPDQIRWLRIVTTVGLLLLLVWSMIFLLDIVGEGFSGGLSLISHPDSRVLDVTIIEPDRETINDFSEVTIISNKEVSMVQIENTTFQSLGELEGQRYYLVRVLDLEVGKNSVRLDFVDESESKYGEDISIKRLEYNYPIGFESITPWEESEYILEGDNLDVEVDRGHRLLEDYEPNDLVDLNSQLGLFTLNNARLRSEAAFALRDMLRDLNEKTGKSVTVASGYRSFSTQASTYGNWVRELGESRANAVSAHPGHSEHQLGTTVDFVSDGTNWKITNKFGKTVAGKWLADNAADYGFVIPFNEDNSQVGGYKEESWHFRFVGRSSLDVYFESSDR